MTILAGQTTATIDVEVLDDSIIEATESVGVTLTGITSGDPGISVGSTNTATVNIVDDELNQTVTIAATANGAEPGADGQFTVTLSNPSSTNTVVSYSVSGTANAGIDYTALTASVTILAGQTTATINVDVLDDTIVENTETVVVTLGTITSGDADISVGSANTATVNIVDDDIAQTPVEVAGIFLNSTFWTSAFRDQVDGSTANEATFGYELTASNISQNIPWVNVNEIVVQFASAIDIGSLDVSDFVLTGTPGSKFDPGQVDGSIPTVTGATLDPSDPTAVRLTLSHFLEPAIIDVNIRASGLTSNGSAGTDNSVQFRSLPGDVDSSDRVLIGGDATAILPQNGAQLGDANYNFRADVDGSGRILFGDAAQVMGRLGDFLPTTPSFSLSSFSSSISADSDDQSDRNSNQSAASAKSDLSGAVKENNSLQNVDDTFADLFGERESDSTTVDDSSQIDVDA